MTGKVVDLIKSILGLSGLAYAVGFLVVNTEFLRWGGHPGKDLPECRLEHQCAFAWDASFFVPPK